LELEGFEGLKGLKGFWLQVSGFKEYKNIRLKSSMFKGSRVQKFERIKHFGF
jgi:hypothetical protein